MSLMDAFLLIVVVCVRAGRPPTARLGDALAAFTARSVQLRGIYWKVLCNDCGLNCGVFLTPISPVPLLKTEPFELFSKAEVGVCVLSVDSELT